MSQPEFQRLHPQLPIFGSLLRQKGVVYAPGHVVVISTHDWPELRRALHPADRDRRACSASIQQLATELMHLAAAAQHRYHSLATAEFEPECLTVYLSNHCNLKCRYCYSGESDGSRKGEGGRSMMAAHAALPVIELPTKLPVLSEEHVAAAAKMVAHVCRAQGKPFQLVVHGGGEPTLHPQLLERVVSLTQATAAQFGLAWTGYIATHGVLADRVAQWLGKLFPRVGVSLDGPPDVQGVQRPRSVRGEDVPTYDRVARTIRMLQQTSAAVSLRTTVTRRTVARQSELVSFFHAEFGPCELTFEPAYNPHGRREDSLLPDDAFQFATHFLAAERLASALGCQLELSGVRLDEIHGPFCNVLRHVLQLTPDGSATACFLCTDGSLPDDRPFVIGRTNSAAEFVVDRPQSQQIQARGLRIPVRCEDCVNIYHCSRDCPDVCPVIERDPQRHETPGFRCQVQKHVAERWIRNLADVDQSPQRCLSPQDAAEFGRLLRCLPREIDVDAIVRQWLKTAAQSSPGSREMPQPPWAKRTYEHTGDEVWEQIQRASRESDETTPLAVYLHLPFCDRKCLFCDCYMQYLSPAHRHRETALLDGMLREIDAWNSISSIRSRPVSTVHLGGGTPTYLSWNHLERLLDEVGAGFRVTPSTEWAVETTTSQLTDALIGSLWEKGVRRLHVGVQTLDDELRKRIGRREDAVTVRRKLCRWLERGFIVSVDLMYGLPDLTIGRFLADIDELAWLGIDGCSLYRLNASPRNAAFIAEHRPSALSQPAEFTWFHAGEQLLRQRGFQKNHFAHFARPRDRNVYYTHVTRGEDLVAIGPTADGSIGNYCYRHPILDRYLAADSAVGPVFEGGLSESLAEVRRRPIVSSLMAGGLSAELIRSHDLAALCDRWLDCEWLMANSTNLDLTLTASGSWQITLMLSEVAHHLGDPG